MTKFLSVSTLPRVPGGRVAQACAYSTIAGPATLAPGASRSPS